MFLFIFLFLILVVVYYYYILLFILFFIAISHRLLNLAGPQGRKKSMGGLQEGRAHITLILTLLD